MKLCLIILILGTMPIMEALKYEVTNMTFCPDLKSNRAYILNVTSWIKDDQQQFLGTGYMTKEFNNDNTYEIDIQKVLGKKSLRLLLLKGKESCKTLNAQGGAAWTEVATMAKVAEPNKCPIPKNNYTLDIPWTLNTDKLPLLKMVPKGKFNIKAASKDLKGNIDFCMRLTFQRF